MRAINAYLDLGYELFYWRTAAGQEVDFILYGERGIRAIEVKRSARIRPEDTQGLRAFLKDYPMAQASLLYGGSRRMTQDGIEIIPVETFLKQLPEIL